jgi:hypothetical protein
MSYLTGAQLASVGLYQGVIAQKPEPAYYRHMQNDSGPGAKGAFPIPKTCTPLDAMAARVEQINQHNSSGPGGEHEPCPAESRTSTMAV